LASYQYDGEQELVFPTLGLTVKKGDVFEAPEGLVLPGVTIASGKKAKAAEVIVEESPAPETLGE
jgi:hypothetical protein